MPALEKSDKKLILDKLAELSGKIIGDDAIRREGTSLILPAAMSPKAAIDTLAAYMENQEREVPLVHRTKFRYLDGVVATKRVLRQLTGMTPSQLTYQTLFGPVTPPSINVPISLTETEACPTGEFPVEIFEGTVQIGQYRNPEMGTLFQITVTAPRKYEAAARGFFELIDRQLAENSIYRGKAVTAQETPAYLDLNGVNPNKVVYSQETYLQLDANIWALIEHTDAMRKANLPLKRAVLLEGPYGTGKTLAAFLTAQRAVANGWTFIFARPGKDSLMEAMSTAQLYQPSVVFFEDIDTTSNDGSDVSALLDIFDGIQAKGTEIIAVLTTNHPEKIHKGLVRPGRLDAVVHIGALDSPGIETLIRATIDAQWLPESLDMEAISVSMASYAPAFIKEAIDRAVRYSLARNEGVLSVLHSQDFVDAGNGLRAQLQLMEGAPESFPADSIEKAIGRIFGGFTIQETGERWTANVVETKERI